MIKRIEHPLISVEEIRRTTVRFQQNEVCLAVSRDTDMITVTMMKIGLQEDGPGISIDMTPQQLGAYIERLKPLAELVAETPVQHAQPVVVQRRGKGLRPKMPGMENRNKLWSNEELTKAGTVLTAGGGYAGAAHAVKRTVKAVKKMHARGKLLGAPAYAPDEMRSLSGSIGALNRWPKQASSN
jgi:hypothetical protein